MQLIGNTGRLPLARVLAIAALLCAGVLQVQEAGHGHWHDLDDRYSQCLLCKNSSSAAIPLAASEQMPTAAAITDVPLICAPLRDASARSFDARGPPVYS